MNRKQKKRLNKILCAFVFFIAGMIINRLPFWNMHYVAEAVFILAYIIVGKSILLKAFNNIKGGQGFD